MCQSKYHFAHAVFAVNYYFIANYRVLDGLFCPSSIFDSKRMRHLEIDICNKIGKLLILIPNKRQRQLHSEQSKGLMNGDEYYDDSLSKLLCLAYRQLFLLSNVHRFFRKALVEYV